MFIGNAIKKPVRPFSVRISDFERSESVYANRLYEFIIETRSIAIERLSIERRSGRHKSVFKFNLRIEAAVF